MTERDPLRFAEKLLGLLDSGRYTATYKFAVLAALIDVCVEGVDEAGKAPDRVSARRVGVRVLELFWRHARPYRADEHGVRHLRHSTQAGDLVSRITAFREEHGFGAGVSVEVARVQAPAQFAVLEDHVVTTVIRMPLPKLQRFSTGRGFSEDRFLYDFAWEDEVAPGRIRRADFDDTLYLRAGVGEWLVRLAGVLRPIVQQRWAAFVADRSRDIVEAAWLDDFLFGTTRAALERVRLPLLEAQDGGCFYCRGPAPRDKVHVDHFIPWVRHPDNGLANLVAAHDRCNNAKRDSLAATVHLERWLERTRAGSRAAAALAEVQTATGWPNDEERTVGAARAAYLWVPDGTLLWQDVGLYARADAGRLRALLVA